MNRTQDEAGASLVELLVASGIMAIVGVIFTTGVIQVYRTQQAAEADAITQGELSRAMLRLDRAVRYAYFIGTPHTEAGGVPYVEYFSITPDVASGTHVKQCVQLRLAGTDPLALRLETRSWKQTAATAAPTGWVTLASHLTRVNGAAPFTRTSPTQAVNHQLLTVRLGARYGTTTKATALSFTAMNTYQSTSSDAVTGNPIPVATEPCYDSGART